MISIIVPIFNSEQHLVRCLNSLRFQTYHRIEILLVDDGSTDSSRKICEKYNKMDSRFRLIYTNRIGISAMRNVGLLASKGDYIGFVHPSDWVEENMFEQLLTMLTKFQTDIVVCRYIEETRNQLIFPPGPESIRPLTPEEAIHLLLVQDRTDSFLCNKLFSMKLFTQEPAILFDQTIHLYEDLDICCQLYLKSQSILYVPEPRYHYMAENHLWKSELYDNYVSGLTALLKIMDRLNNHSSMLVEMIKEVYLRLNIQLIMIGYSYKPTEKKRMKELKYNLYRFKLSEIQNASLKRVIIMTRISIPMGYYFWERSAWSKTK